jgi:hypothetical protein
MTLASPLRRSASRLLCALALLVSGYRSAGFGGDCGMRPCVSVYTQPAPQCKPSPTNNGWYLENIHFTRGASAVVVETRSEEFKTNTSTHTYTVSAKTKMFLNCQVNQAENSPRQSFSYALQRYELLRADPVSHN